MTTTKNEVPKGPKAQDMTVDVLVVGSGTGLCAALAAHEQGLSTLVVEKTEFVGGSTALSGGAFWIPGNPVLEADGSADTVESGKVYLDDLVGDAASEERRDAFLEHGPETVRMLQRATPLQFFWAKGYSDYHPERPGGSAIGRTCEAKPYDENQLGDEVARLRKGELEAPIPMPITGADYKWMNLMMRTPFKAFPRAIFRGVQGIGGMVMGRKYVGAGEALAAGMFRGCLDAGIPIWTNAKLVDLLTEGDRVTGALIDQEGTQVTVTATKGVILATGGFDHDIDKRREEQTQLLEDVTFGSPGNMGDGIREAQELGADTDLLDQAWWFPAVAPLPGENPGIMLAERSLPGSLIVNQNGERFINESIDYMSFGQRFIELDKEGNPVEAMWMVFDQKYRNSYVLGGVVMPMMPLPKSWYEHGIAAKADTVEDLARQIDVPAETLQATLDRFNQMAAYGIDHDFNRGASAYDRYYGDPTVSPNPNLRPLEGKLYAVRIVLADLGTCGGLKADGRGRVLRQDGSAIDGLYAIGNTAANAFGSRYPGAGATIAQGLVYGRIAALDCAGRND